MLKAQEINKYVYTRMLNLNMHSYYVNTNLGVTMVYDNQYFENMRILRKFIVARLRSNVFSSTK